MFTSEEEKRILAIEEMLNKLQTATKNLASKRQLNQLLMLKQAEVDELTKRVAALESQLAALQGSLG
jgi:polyhydroxyalkanoate synthesis regulator phasin